MDTDDYVNEIAVACASLGDAEVNLKTVLGELEDIIVGAYNGVPFETYKSRWIQRVVLYFKSINVSGLFCSHPA
ncbi:hypothetical protein PS15m_006625 [Mucor circinelloides]